VNWDATKVPALLQLDRLIFVGFDQLQRPHDVDGVADHIGGAFLALGPLGMGVI
jgi:hypothetical protein